MRSVLERSQSTSCASTSLSATLIGYDHDSRAANSVHIFLKTRFQELQGVL